MERLITIEEHFISDTISQKCTDVIMAHGTEGEKQARKPAGNGGDPLSGDIGARRIAYMDKMGIDAQILSYIDHYPSELPAQFAIPLCREANDEMYAATVAHPGRLYAFATLPLDDPKAAADELERTVTKLNFKGALISGFYKDHRLDDGYYNPIWEKATQLDVPIYLHPDYPNDTIRDYYYKGAWSDQAAALLSGFGIGWHYEIGMQIVRMIMGGVFDRYPKLKICTGHWGEVVSYYMYRMDEISRSITGLKKNISAYFKENVYVNPSGMMYEPQLRFCLDTFGEDHILWGEDYPKRMPENIRTMLENADISETVREKIAHRNAERLFGISFR